MVDQKLRRTQNLKLEYEKRENVVKQLGHVMTVINILNNGTRERSEDIIKDIISVFNDAKQELYDASVFLGADIAHPKSETERKAYIEFKKLLRGPQETAATKQTDTSSGSDSDIEEVCDTLRICTSDVTEALCSIDATVIGKNDALDLLHMVNQVWEYIDRTEEGLRKSIS